MFVSLMADLVGIQAGPTEAVGVAAGAGFAGLDLRFNRFADEVERAGAERLRSAMAVAGLRAGYCSIVPQKMSVDEATWREEMADAPRRADLAAALGYRRATSVVLPFHPDLAALDNFRLHVDRTREACDVLGERGITFGLEYVSPLTRRRGQPNEFIHDLSGLLELLAAVDRPNAGVMLDSFHWACARETADDLRLLRPERVVAVHVNDLIAGRSLDEQSVAERELPGVSGLIDLGVFLGTLAEIGYDGPITAEPTHPRWGETAAAEAARLTFETVSGSIERAVAAGSAHEPRGEQPA